MAGAWGINGTEDGRGEDARFFPFGIRSDGVNLYVAMRVWFGSSHRTPPYTPFNSADGSFTVTTSRRFRLTAGYARLRQTTASALSGAALFSFRQNVSRIRGECSCKPAYTKEAGSTAK